MNKFNVLAALLILFWVQICFSGEIPSDYKFQFFDKKTAPHRNWTDFGSGGCSGTESDSCAKKNEVQGITTFKNIEKEEEKKYWILSKNKWFYVYKLDEGESLFSRSHETDTFENKEYESGNKMKDIDFFENRLYVPRGNKIDIFEWNNETEKFDKENIVTWYLDTESFGVAIHPYSKHVFYQASMDKVGSTKIIGRKIINNTLSDKEYKIELKDRNDDPINHNMLTNNFTRQGMTFSPNGRFLFFVHDDDHDKNSEYTGIHVYYLDYDNYNKLFSDDASIEAFRVGFKRYKYDPDSWGDDNSVRLDELEGIAVEEIQGYDVHQLFLHNTRTDSDEEYSVDHYKTGDYDGDGIKDIYDKCPFIPDDQADIDGDGIGDECDLDRDGDGVPNIHDNCPDDYNPNQENWNISDDGKIEIGDACQDSDDDGWKDIKDACPGYKNKDTCDDENCRDSDSECCVSARKDCDMDGDGRWDEESAFESFYDNYGFTVDALGEGGKDNCKTINQHSHGSITIWYKVCDVGRFLSIKGGAVYLKGGKGENNKKYTQAKISSYYCYCGNTKEDHKDCEDSGKCGKDHANPDVVWNKVYEKPTWMPLYGKGDYKEKNFETILSDRCYDRKCFTPFERDWEYREDEWLMSQIGEEDNNENDDTNSNIVFQMVENSDEDSEEDIPRIKLSHAAVFTNNADYIDESDRSVNKTFFSNSGSHQTHLKGASWNQNLIMAQQSTETVDLIVEKRMFFGGYITPGFGKWYWEMLREYIGEKPWRMENLPFARQFEDIVKENMYETISRPSLFSRVSYNGDELKVKAVRYPKNYNQIFAYAAQDGIYYKENNVFKLAFSDAAGIFRNAETVQNGFEMRSAAVAVKGIEIYMAAGMTITPSSQIRNQNYDNPAEEKPIRNQRFARIYFTRGEAVMEELASLPWAPEYITLFKTNDRIHAMMMNENGLTSILKYSSDNNSWTTLNTFNFGQVFSLNNTFVRDNKLYFTAPNAEGKTALYTWNEINGFVEIAHLDSEYDSFIKPFEFGGKIILADLKDISGKSVDSWQLNETYFEKEKISLDKPKFAQKFCINETGNSIFPGITNFYGECVKVENYDFDEVTFPDYKLSVAGYRNSLYLGGLTGIRRVEIGENGEITKKEMIYSGESNNLAVYGNTLYAANYGEIDIFEIADSGKIERKSSVKTNNCKNIRIDGGKLFAAENKRVRIFDLNDPVAPEVLKTVSLGNTVEDLETAGNQLFVYENLNGLLTRKGKVSVFDVSDIENPQKIKEFAQYCNDPEMQKSGNSVYLGCKNGSFKVTESGLQKVNGSKNYLREGYVFDGILYQVFSGTLHESSTESAETEEDGWL